MRKCFILVIVVLAMVFSVSAYVPVVAATAKQKEELYQWNLEIYNRMLTTDKGVQEYYLMPTKTIQSDNEEILKTAESICKNISAEYDKAKAIHNWVSDNIWYDYDAFEGRSDYGDTSALGTLRSKRSVCDGYANLTVALMRAAGIPAKYVSGYALGISGKPEIFYDLENDKSNHAWCEAFVNNKWIILDTTWDSNNKYRNGSYSAQEKHSNTYFDISMHKFSENHRYNPYSIYSKKDGWIINISTGELVEILFDTTLINEITIPNGVTSIGTSAFGNSFKLKDINLPDSLTSIGHSAFHSNISLTSITIPNNVKSIEYEAFSGCSNLRSVYIPDSVMEIGEYAFSNSYRMYDNHLTIYGTEGSYAEKYADENNINFIVGTADINNDERLTVTEVAILDGTTFIEEEAFKDYANLVSVTIPDSVTSIGMNAFANCVSLMNINIPGSVTVIGEYAFENCVNLTDVNIPDSVTSIERHAFQNCVSLTKINLPESLKSIGIGVFFNCASLIDITIPSGVTAIEALAFRDCASLQKITIPNGVTGIEGMAFSGCIKLQQITIPGSVININDAFWGCPDLVIYGSAGSYAEEYAKSNNIKFINEHP